MKRTFGSLLAVFLMAGSGIAQQSRPAAKPVHKPDMELVRHFEAWSRHHPEAAGKLKARMDQNGDGRIDASERELALQVLRERREEFREWVRTHPDKRKDQDPSPATRPAETDKDADKDRGRDKDKDKDKDRPVPVPGRADQNRDGKVDKKEADRARQIQRAKERMEAKEREKEKQRQDRKPAAGK